MDSPSLKNNLSDNIVIANNNHVLLQKFSQNNLSHLRYNDTFSKQFKSNLLNNSKLYSLSGKILEAITLNSQKFSPFNFYEYSVEDLQNYYENGHNQIKIDNNLLALRLKSSRSYLENYPIKTINIFGPYYKKLGLKVQWEQSEGLFQLGKKTKELSFGRCTNKAVKANFNSLIKYKKIKPLILNEDKNNQGFQIPFCAQIASNMLPGTFFEITAENSLLLGTKAKASRSWGGANIKLATTAKIKAENKHEKDLTFSILKLPSKKTIRFNIIRSSIGHSALIANLTASLKEGQGIYDFIPSSGLIKAVINYALKYKNISSISQISQQYFQAHAHIESSFNKSEVSTQSYDLDLSDACVAKAYDSFFHNMTDSNLQLLLNKGNKNLTYSSKNDTSDVNSFLSFVQWSDQKLALYKAVDKDQKILISNSNGHKKISLISSYKQKMSAILLGNQSVTWKQCKSVDKNNNCENYYNISFENNDLFCRQREIDNFLGFASALGIINKNNVEVKPLDMWDFTKLFSIRDNTITKGNIFFTQDGIENIDKSSFQECVAAHLLTQGYMYNSVKRCPLLTKKSDQRLCQLDTNGQAFKLVKEYHDFYDKNFIFRMVNADKILKNITVEYKRITGRDIVVDAWALRRAEIFACKLQELDLNKSTQETSRFFADLGAARGFAFMAPIATMAILAGPEDTLVREISINNECLNLRSIDENLIL